MDDSLYKDFLNFTHLDSIPSAITTIFIFSNNSIFFLARTYSNLRASKKVF